MASDSWDVLDVGQVYLGVDQVLRDANTILVNSPPRIEARRLKSVDGSLDQGLKNVDGSLGQGLKNVDGSLKIAPPGCKWRIAPPGEVAV